MATAATADVRTLLARGQEYRRSGDHRAAASFFQAAIKAVQAGAPAPPDLHAALRDAQAFLQQAAQQFVATIAEAVEASGAAAEPRIAHALDIVAGQRPIYYQEPSVLYLPYLPQRQFYEREEFAWAGTIEAATPVIKAELLALLAEEEAGFEPYIQAESNRPHKDFHGLQGDPSWSAYYLWRDGQLVAEHAARFPRTVEALRQVPLSAIGRRTPSVLFSLLRPGAHIPPHTGMLNCRLICHLPLIVPPGCWLRVGSETREWHEGELMIFDDSIDHEARNTSAETRVILLFDVWRPELGDAERRGVAAMFDAIDRMGGVPDEQ